MTHDLVIKHGTVVTPELGQFEADIGTDGGTITELASPGSLDGDRAIDADGKYVLPGAIDPHVHYGLYRDFADDHETETRSNLVGGVTTVGNIFRRGQPYLEVMDEYFERSERNSYHDYFYTLGILSDAHVDEIPAIIEQLGVTSFKWYMLYKLVAAEKFGLEQNLTEDIGDRMIQQLAAQDVPTTLGYHAENVEITSALEERARDAGETGFEGYATRFPGYAETQSMVASAALAKQHGYDDRFYSVHISSGRTADELASLRRAGYRLWGETCPHYLTLTAEECDDRMKVTPPMRSTADRETLWERVADGTISCIGTDHVANTREEKLGDTIWETLLAFPSSPLLLPLMISEGVHGGRISVERLVEVTSTNTARAWNLFPKKGTVRVGSDADLVVVDLEETKTVTPGLLRGAADYSPYEGWEVTGWPTHTVVRGRVAYEDGEVVGQKGFGTHVDRPV